MDDEIAKFIRRVNPPRVVIDNEVCKNVTVIKGAGHVNHSIFWKNLAPVKEGGGEPPKGSLRSAIDTHFGSLEGLVKKMNAEGAAIQGSGWVWLGLDKELKKLVVDTTANQVQLSEQLMSNVIFKKLGDSEVAWVDSEVGKTERDMRSLVPMAGAASPHKPVLVGDLKIADFKQFLSSKGVQVEFAGGGALRCGEYVTVRKVGPTGQKGGASGPQQILIEGPLCEDYYKIRDYLYSQFYLL